MSVQVTLTWYEYIDCVNIGLYRFAASNLAGLNHANAHQRTWLQRLEDEVVGTCGERAWHKYRGDYWDTAVNTFHHQPDAPGKIEVRTTLRPDGCLILRDNDPADRFYVLVTGQAPTLTIIGGITGHDGRRQEWLRAPNGDRPAWFIPQQALRPAPERISP